MKYYVIADGPSAALTVANMVKRGVIPAPYLHRNLALRALQDHPEPHPYEVFEIDPTEERPGVPAVVRHVVGITGTIVLFAALFTLYGALA